MKKLCLIIILALLVFCGVESSFGGKKLFKTVEEFITIGKHRTGTPADTATCDWSKEESTSKITGNCEL